jgi:hypothetical protein
MADDHSEFWAHAFPSSTQSEFTETPFLDGGANRAISGSNHSFIQLHRIELFRWHN